VVAAFRKGLSETGYAEPQNVTIDFRWAEGQFDCLPALASELVRRPVDLIAALGESGPAAKAATTTIPIVFGSGGDPVEMGLVASLNRPGGNITGATFLTASLGAKRLGLLNELVPGAPVVALLVNPNTSVGRVQMRDVQEAARALGQSLVVLDAGSDERIEAAFGALSPRTLVRFWSALIRFSTQGCCIGVAASSARDLPVSRICTRRWPDELRYQYHRHVPTGGRLHWSRS
jgi:putative tryptophan/tyrosine transport system substrate-binding protein